ncbi:NAD(P)H-hydrate dehydratase [Pedobacter sp. SD-b]|uniref:Bifunctional NAD(P)H-hydrate repair enzyme n=1 Tax=Pedobacter segetis TaxID=2793069 RepID=A0ABS1BKP8_9SPHI|nr:NAD(P)H-hydrate dehydratase [Pedobacter segetis]MBK0382794.1 NAD(P)H-hydrate dehydratase [Pedobacter segetis]
MLKLLTAAQTKEADHYTVINEPIRSSELMERASKAFVKLFIEKLSDRKKKILIFCGKGNNGGDGLAIARLLIDEGYTFVKIFIAEISEKSTEDFELNLERLQLKDTSIFYFKTAEDIEYQECDILIDALLGSGLNKPLEKEWEKLVKKINKFSGYKIAVDVPTGMPCEGELFNDIIIKSDLTITFQRPKLNFLLPISSPYIKEWKVVNIGLDENYIQSTSSPYYWFWKGDVQNYIKARQPFEHKGMLGHALIIAGNDETMGAALISSEACVKCGAGLTSAMIPKTGLRALNARVPEAMFTNKEKLGNLDWDKFKVIGIGPGLGSNDDSLSLLKTVLKNFKNPMVIDADAINMIGENQDLLKSVPKNSVFTPHMKEFDRLFGTHDSWWKRIETALKKSVDHQIYIVLKNRYTMIFTPQGICYFNSSGSPAMASGGMGDALTGIITGMISQGYSIEKAVQLAVFSHGFAGEQLAQKMYVVPATSLIKNMPYILRELLVK